MNTSTRLVNLSLMSFLALAIFGTTVQAGGSHGGSNHLAGYPLGGYIGLDGTSVSVESLAENDINPRGLRFRLGMRVNQLFDVEAQFGGGSDETVLAYDSLGTRYIGLYLKGYLPLGRRSALFALAGGSAVEFTQTTDQGKFTDDRSGFSYGFGMETQLSRHLDLSADFMRYTLDDNEFSEV